MLFAVLAALALGPVVGHAQPVPSPVAKELSATLARIVGEVFARHAEADWADATQGQKFTFLDEIQTGPESEATLEFSDGSQVTVKQLTQMRIGGLLSEQGRIQARVLLKMGEITAKLKRQETIRSDFSIKTPTATASVRGTEFKRISYWPSRGTEVELLSGKVEVKGKKGLIEVGPKKPSRVLSDGTLLTPSDILASGSRIRAEPAGLTQPEIDQVQATNQPQANPISRAAPSSFGQSNPSGGGLVFRYSLK